jgi:hypothetical protein
MRKPRPLTLIIAGLLLVASTLVVVNQVRIARRHEANRIAHEAARQRREAAERVVVPEDVMQRRRELADELRTVTLQNCELKRVGGASDGGYLMCGNLLTGLQSAYSYGIGSDDDWGCEVSRTHRVPVHQYDCFAPTKVRCFGGDLRLNAQCVGPRTEVIDGRSFDTFAAQITTNGDSGRKIAVKVDIEGAEWDALLATPDDVLAAIDQMPMELHGVDEPSILPAIRKLKQHFHLVAIHFNNMACTAAARPLPASAYQVLLVSKRIGVVGPPPAGSPTPESLMVRDSPKEPDCQEIKR